MLFAHDTTEALQAAANLVNTAQTDPDSLATVRDLDAFIRRWGWSGCFAHDATELAAVRALRPILREFWHLDTDGAAALVNRLLCDAGALPQLVRHDGLDYHLHATPASAPLVDRMAVEAAMAMVDVVRMGELNRLQVCAASDCADVLVDLSKNRSRRFCSATCANRVNVAAFRNRRRAGE